ncbi:MAG: hypothetical protein Kow0029_15980 [Candidatus Rifleibacteriota bacterium]
MTADSPLPVKGHGLSFFRLIIIPFFLISIFSQVYTDCFMLAFLVDNSEAVKIAKNSGVSSSEEISKAIAKAGLRDPEKISKSVNQYRSDKNNSKISAKISGSFLALALRLAALILLYFWMRPLTKYLTTRDQQIFDLARRRYDNFYLAVFSYLFLTHLIWFLSYTLQVIRDGRFFQGLIYHLVWLTIECYLFYLYLEPTLFMYVSSHFANFGSNKVGRSSLSIYGKLITMLFFLVLVPMAIIAAYVHFEYITLQLYQYNTLFLLATSAAFLIGNMQLLYKSIQEPINFLVEKMRLLAEGNFNVQTSVLFNDEIGKLKQNFNLMVEQLKEREELKDTFGKYVSIEVAKHLLENKKVDLGGETIKATILFSDIRNFTSMSERMSPEEVVTMLNTYFSYITPPIMENNGVINKFIGDAVMAIFTPHLGSENHVKDAINACIGMRKKLKELNASGKLKLPIKFGIGLNSGDLVAGNIGTEKRFEYTVIGDTVNVASRMESLTKELNTDIVFSENTMNLIDHELLKKIAIEKTEPVKIKGKSQPMPVYKLL